MKQKETVILRPKIKLTEKDVKCITRCASITGVSMSEWVKMQVKLALEGSK